MSSAAGAQAFGRVFVVPAYVDGDEAGRRSDDVERALRLRRIQIVSQHEGRDRLLATSRPPAVQLADDVTVMKRELEAAIEHLAFGHVSPARRSIDAVLVRAERAMETLNRESRTARVVLDACLGLVRAELQKKDRHKAVQQAIACRRLVPDLAPSDHLHPADVVGVVAEADDQLRRMRLGPIQVKSTSEEGCSVYANGRHVGTTPFTFERIAAGEYRFQLDCRGIQSRVHVVTLVDEPIEIGIDTQLDEAIDTKTRVSLRYPSFDAQATRALKHASAVGSVVRADDVILI
jgi:hypothetical protein